MVGTGPANEKEDLPSSILDACNKCRAISLLSKTLRRTMAPRLRESTKSSAGLYHVSLNDCSTSKRRNGTANPVAHGHKGNSERRVVVGIGRRSLAEGTWGQHTMGHQQHQHDSNHMEREECEEYMCRCGNLCGRGGM